mgnify:CR=1 FL=1
MFPIDKYLDQFAQISKDHPGDKQAEAYSEMLEVVRGQGEMIDALVHKCAYSGMQREMFMPFLIEACTIYNCAYPEADYGQPFPYGVPEYILNDRNDMNALKMYRDTHDLTKKPSLADVLNNVADSILGL